MVGLYLSIWVRTGLLPNIGGVQITSVGTGIMRYLGNKGVALIYLVTLPMPMDRTGCLDKLRPR